jgi:hypothetical protein
VLFHSRANVKKVEITNTLSNRVKVEKKGVEPKKEL